MKEKYRYLFKNTGLFMVSSFASKFLVFLLVPLYTHILTTEEYGSYDLIYSTIQLLLPILSLNIVDSVMRFSVGAEESVQRSAFTVGARYIGLSVILAGASAIFCSRVLHLQIMERYGLEFVLLYLALALNQFTGQFARGLEDVKGVAVSGVVATVILIFCNLIFLLFLKIGLRGYFYAYILSFLLPAVYLFFRNRMYRYWTGGFRIAGEKEMLLYAVPLLFNTISWSINSVADRYAVTWFCGLDANGLYSVAYKVPAILNAVSTVFIQAWQLSAVREYRDQEDLQFYRVVYKGCHAIMLPLCACLIFSTRFLSRILYAKEFFEAWVFVPTLLVYLVFNTFSGIISGIFSAVKDTRIVAKTAVIGAVVNILLNIVLISLWGVAGAALATLISSMVIWKLRQHYARRYIDYGMDSGEEGERLLLLFLQAGVMTLMPTPLGYGIQLLLMAGIFFLSFRLYRTIR